MTRVAILAGGKGVRMGPMGRERPKPLTMIGDKPILEHICLGFHRHGFSEIVVAVGARGDEIRACFEDRRLPFAVEFVDTGGETRTAGRLKRLRSHLGEGSFFSSVADGLHDIDLAAMHRFHASHGEIATAAAVHPPSRFGVFDFDGERIIRMREKPVLRDQWVNGGVFVLEQGVFDYIAGDDTQWEDDTLPALARDKHVMAFRHDGFWQCMDTPAEAEMLETMWRNKQASWLPGG